MRTYLISPVSVLYCAICTIPTLLCVYCSDERIVVFSAPGMQYATSAPSMSSSVQASSRKSFKMPLVSLRCKDRGTDNATKHGPYTLKLLRYL